MPEDKYPHPKKGERVKCLACNDGKVLQWVKGKGFVPTRCRACGGKGHLTA